MGELHHFVPRAHLTAADNLSAFVEACRNQLTVFGADLDFDADVWDVTEASNRRASSNAERISFCTLATTGRSRRREPLAEPYKSFAKAYIRYQQGLRPTKNVAHRFAAHRVIEQTLRETQAGDVLDPTSINADLLNRAAELAKRRFKTATAYRVGVNIELIAQFLDEHHLTPAVIGWRNPLKRPADGARVGVEFEEKRAKKLPSQAALQALPAVFNLATESRDVIQASVGAILSSVPARISELLTLPEDCEAPPPPGGDPTLYGLRWWPAKGADPQVKWVIPSMVDVVRRAIVNIRRETDEARRVAAWYEANPGKLYLPNHLEYLRDRERIHVDELAKMLQIGGEGFCRNHRIKRSGGKAYFRDVEEKVLSLLPSDFPVFDRETGTSYSKALFVVLKNQFRVPSPMTCMIERVNHQHIADGFGAGVGRVTTSLFSRLGFTEADSSPIRVTTHQFRHMLNTMAQKGGATQFDIAKWSGRKDLSQNTIYDHESAGELLSRVQATVGDAGGLFGLPARIQINEPATREQYAQLVAPTAHTTEIGFCLHDFAASPCQLHMDCLRCTEHVCVKGNRHKTEVIRKRLTEARSLLAKAEDGMSAEAWGADRWVEAQTENVARLEALLAILEDRNLPDGTIIRVGGPGGPSRVITAARERGIESAPSATTGNSTLALARDLLGDMGGGNGEAQAGA